MDLYNRVNEILTQNHTSSQKFVKLVELVKTLGIDTVDKLVGVTELLFKKGVEGPGFAIACANFCKCLGLLRIPVDVNPDVYVDFKILLNTKCYLEIQKNTADEQAKSQLLRDIETAKTEKTKKELNEKYLYLKQKVKRTFLGSIRFARELFSRNLIPGCFLHYYLTTLVAQRDEDLLQCLCDIFITVGKALDSEKPQNGFPPKDNVMDSCFNQMREIVNKRETTPWILGKMKYVIDLRRYNWLHSNERKSSNKVRQQSDLVAPQNSQERGLQLPAASHTRSYDCDKRRKENDAAYQDKVDQSQATSILDVETSPCISKVTLSKSEIDLIELFEEEELSKKVGKARGTASTGCETSPSTEPNVGGQFASEPCRCKPLSKMNTKCQEARQNEDGLTGQTADKSHLKTLHDRLEPFAEYAADLLKDVAVNERRKCQADILKVINGYADRCIVKVEIYVNKE